MSTYELKILVRAQHFQAPTRVVSGINYRSLCENLSRLCDQRLFYDMAVVL